MYLAYSIATITGTSSLIFFTNESNCNCTVHAVIYQQWGGDLEGVGYTLATFLKHAVVGYTSYERDEEKKIVCCNFGNLVARYISKVKGSNPGHPFYLCPNIPGLEEEYNYHVLWNRNDSLIHVRVNNSSKMSVDEFLKLCGTSRCVGMV